MKLHLGLVRLGSAITQPDDYIRVAWCDAALASVAKNLEYSAFACGVVVSEVVSNTQKTKQLGCLSVVFSGLTCRCAALSSGILKLVVGD